MDWGEVMKLKNICILAISICLLSFLMTSNAVFDGAYVRVHAGPAFQNDLDLGFSSSAKISYKTGFSGGLALGYKSGALRYEVEYAYLRANPDNVTLNGVDTSGVDGSASVSAGLLNVLYNFERVNAKWYPYFGVGVGAAHLNDHVRATGLNVSRSTSDEFAYQLIAGLGYKLSRQLNAELDYRFLGTTNFRYTIGSAISREPFYNSNINLALQYSF